MRRTDRHRMGDERQTAPPDPSLNEDLYCLECGYNLRGLSGDPRRCPECGHLNPLSELTIPAETIRAHLTKLESAPTFAITCTLLLALGALSALARGYVCAVILLFAGVVGLLASVTTFGQNSRWKPGWIGVLAWFYFVGACMFIPLFVGVIIVIAFTPFGAYAALYVIAMALIVGILVRPLYRAARRRLLELQRATAVELAKQSLDRRMHRRH